MQLKPSNRGLDLAERKIEYSPSGFTGFYSTRVMEYLDLVNGFIVVLTIRMGFIDSASCSKIGGYIGVVASLEDIFVQISHGLRIGASFNVDMGFILLQQSGIVGNHPLVVSILSFDGLARRTTISRKIRMMTQIRHH